MFLLLSDSFEYLLTNSKQCQQWTMMIFLHQIQVVPIVSMRLMRKGPHQHLPTKKKQLSHHLPLFRFQLRVSGDEGISLIDSKANIYFQWTPLAMLRSRDNLHRRDEVHSSPVPRRTRRQISLRWIRTSLNQMSPCQLMP